jgi:hypothetical protein
MRDDRTFTQLGRAAKSCYCTLGYETGWAVASCEEVEYEIP